MNKKLRGKLSMPSTDITSDVVLDSDGENATLSFTFDDGGNRFDTGITFHKVRAGRWRAEGHCTKWQIDGAYDTIVEVQGSDWIDELSNPESLNPNDEWPMHHFMLYMDSAGCFEFVAESWHFLPIVESV